MISVVLHCRLVGRPDPPAGADALPTHCRRANGMCPTRSISRGNWHREHLSLASLPPSPTVVAKAPVAHLAAELEPSDQPLHGRAGSNIYEPAPGWQRSWPARRFDASGASLSMICGGTWRDPVASLAFITSIPIVATAVRAPGTMTIDSKAEHASVGPRRACRRREFASFSIAS